MSRIIMEKKICIEPSLLDENICDHILDKIRNDILEKCDQEYGYIIKIYDKIKILNNKISPDGIGIFFNVKFGVKAIKPEIGCFYKGIVCMIFSQGIFVEVFGKIKVLIPLDKLGSYKWDKNNSYYKLNNLIIQKESEIELRIDNIKYEKQNFNCIGSLKT